MSDPKTTAGHGSPDLDADAAKLEAMGADPGPTIAELEAMLNDPTPYEIQMKPDGSIHAVKKPTIHTIEVLAGDHLGRDAKDFAIEFAGYLANAAERYQDAVQGYLRGDDGADELLSERWRNLDRAIYEFRKRAERAKA